MIFLDEGRDIGGAEINLINILKYLDKDKFQPIVILSSKSKFYSAIKNLGIDTVIIKTAPFISTSLEFGNIRIFNPLAIIYNSLNIMIKSLMLLPFLSRSGVVLVQTNGMFEHIWGGITARICRVPCIWHMQDIPSKSFMLGLGRTILNILAMLLPRQIIAVSNEVKNNFFKSTQKKIVVIYNGTDLERFKPKSLEEYSGIREKFNIKDNEIIITMTSRLVPWKGHRVFLESAKIISEQKNNAKFLIVGDTSFGKKKYLNELKFLAIKLKIQDKVIFIGFIENIENILGITDILVHCSIRPEPFGLDIIEAMAMEKVVIATQTGAASEIILNGKEGILVPPKNPKALSSAINRLLDSPKLCKELGKQARKKVEQKFSMERFIKEIMVVYSTFAHGGKPVL